MFGKLGDLAGLMKSAKQIQANFAELQQELATRRYEADAGAGIVTATVDGRGTLLSVKIEPKAAEDMELLEDLIKAAVNSAITKSQAAMQQEMSALTGGLNLPGMSELLGGSGTSATTP